jgi:hypothetical protein
VARSVGAVPVRQDLILAKLGPLPNELKRPGLNTPGKHFAIYRYRSAATRVIGVKVRYRMIFLVPVNLADYPVERADTRHGRTVSDPSRRRQRIFER